MCIKRLILAFLLVFIPITGMASSPAAHPVSPDNGLKMLAEGNLRFTLGQTTHPNTSFSRRLLTTTEGQAPYATVIACSDSRVPVEILFDQGVGDLFVIKVAGNVADTDEIGSAEYGVDHLGTPVLMVLGHTYCGAVTAVATGAEVHGSIPELVDNIIPAVEKARHDHPGADTPDLIVKAIEANIWLAIEDILTKSHAIAERAKDGRVVVVGAVYDILSGKVTVLGTHPNQNELLGAAAPAGHAAPAHAEPATHEVAATEAHAAPADADHAKVASEKAPVEGHAEVAEAPKSGGFGFFSFIAFVILLVGAVVVLDKTLLNPKND